MGSAWSYLLTLGAFGTNIASGIYSYGGYSVIKGIQNYQTSRKLSDAATFFLIASIASWILVLIMAYLFILLLEGRPLPHWLLILCLLLALIIGILGAAAAEYIKGSSFYKDNSTYSEARDDGIFTSILGFVSMLIIAAIWAFTEPPPTPTVKKVENIPEKKEEAPKV